VAAALLALPYVLLQVLAGAGASWLAALVVALAVLVHHAWRRSSPLVVLGAAVEVALAEVLVFVALVIGETCGSGTASAVVRWAGAAPLALGIGAWGVRGGPRLLWAPALGVVAAGAWILLVAHVVPGGAGACVD